MLMQLVAALSEQQVAKAYWELKGHCCDALTSTKRGLGSWGGGIVLWGSSIVLHRSNGQNRIAPPIAKCILESHTHDGVGRCQRKRRCWRRLRQRRRRLRRWRNWGR